MTIVLPITSRANTDANLFSDVYSNDTAIINEVNGNLTNSNLAAAGTANIDPGKLSAGSSAQLLVCNASGVPVYKDVTGDVTVTTGGVTAIGSSKVVTANVADGAVTSRKLAPTLGQVTNASLSQTLSSTTPADLTSMSLSITPSVASKVLVTASFDCEVTDSHSLNQGVFGYLNVDGSRQTTKATMAATLEKSASAGFGIFEVTGAQTWVVSLTAAGHTLKLQAALSTGAGTETTTVNAAAFTYLLVAS